MAMLMKYLQLHLEYMLKSYAINDERISIAIKELNSYYHLCHMYDKKLSLLKKLL